MQSEFEKKHIDPAGKYRGTSTPLGVFASGWDSALATLEDFMQRRKIACTGNQTYSMPTSSTFNLDEDIKDEIKRLREETP
jgi:hypothetical protein